jgi:hypothetical protein
LALLAWLGVLWCGSAWADGPATTALAAAPKTGVKAKDKAVAKDKTAKDKTATDDNKADDAAANDEKKADDAPSADSSNTLPDSPLGKLDLGDVPSGDPKTTDPSTEPPLGGALVDPGTKSSGKAPPKDPVAIAFALPKNLTLNDKQKQAYDKLKAEWEPVYRAALENVNSTDASAKAKALKDIREAKAKIKVGLTQIVTMPVLEAQKKAQEAAKKRYDDWVRSGGLQRQQDEMRRRQEELRRQQDEARRRAEEARRRAGGR